MTRKIAELVIAVGTEIANRVAKCNAPHSKKSNNFFAPMVLIVQNECDAILLNRNISYLYRISLCAKVVNTYNAGNCTHQAFAAFDALMHALIAQQISTLEKTPQIAICSTHDHSFVVIEGMVCDPWLPYCGSLKESPYANKRINTDFLISRDWNCYREHQFDLQSTQQTFAYFNQEANDSSASQDLSRPK